MNEKNSRFGKTRLFALLIGCLALANGSASDPAPLNLPADAISYTVFFDPNYIAGLNLSGIGAGLDVTNGVYGAWCIDYGDQNLYDNHVYTGHLYDSLSGPIPPDVRTCDYHRINYIINHKQGDRTDVNVAIWYFSDRVNAGINATSQAMIHDALANGGNFVPSPGQVTGVILEGQDEYGTAAQTIIVEVPTPPNSACPPVSSSITSGFNGTSISSTNYIWFNANFSAKGVPSSGATIFFNNSKVVINSSRGNFTYSVPDGKIVFTSSASCASTTFDGTQWVTDVPLSGSDEILLSALGIKAPADLKGASVTWSGDFSSDKSGISVSWKWGAAVYTTDMTQPHYNSLGVKPAHTNTCLYNNSDHAGTPENVKGSVVGGARGGGGSNFTGSWSGTNSETLCP